MKLTKLQKRCVAISFQRKLSHLSSVLNTVDVLETIYERREPNDPVVLGNSHAALALFAVLESRGLCDAEEMVRTQGTHAARDLARGVWVSGGSLGQAETIAVGMAVAKPNQTVWLVTSDGACMEGATWEAMRTAAALVLVNLQVTIIYNGYGAYGPISMHWIKQLTEGVPRVDIHRADKTEWPAWMGGLQGHYLTLTDAQYDELMA